MENKNKIGSKKEEQINLTFRSIEGMQRAKANPFLFEKVMSKINQPSSDNREWSYNTGVKYALIMLLFIVLNIATILQISTEKKSDNVTNGNIKKIETLQQSKGYFDDFINNDSYNNF